MSIQTRPDVSPPKPAAVATGKAAHPRRVAAAVVVATAVIGVGLTALVLGVTGDGDTAVPPSPGIPQIYDGEIPHEGLDRRLYDLSEQRGELRKETMQLDDGVDQRLRNLVRE